VKSLVKKYLNLFLLLLTDYRPLSTHTKAAENPFDEGFGLHAFGFIISDNNFSISPKKITFSKVDTSGPP
jgi:hypothetical protein